MSFRRASRARRMSFRGFGRAFEAPVVAERQRDDESDRWTGGDRRKPQSETAGRVLDPTYHEGAEKAREVADRVDRRDARRGSRAGEEGRRQRPEDRLRSEEAEGPDGQRNHLHRRVGEQGRTANADRRERLSDGEVHRALPSKIRS
jgi:hypothetical protein